jgi:HK97 family phage prohead protease
MKAVHKKIAELKLRALPINYSQVSVNERGQLSGNFYEDLDNRIISGYLFAWGRKNMHGEILLRGCCAKSIQERGPNSIANYKITFLRMHDQSEPLCVFAELVEDAYGLAFRSKPLDDVPWADHVLTQVRSGTLNQFSGGFDYVWDKIEYDEAQDALICKEIDLFEGSIVTIGSDSGTMVIRSAQEQELFFDEIEAFTKSLPRKNQLQARQYFAKLKSLIDFEPDAERATLEETEKPVEENAINYEFLLQNL